MKLADGLDLNYNQLLNALAQVLAAAPATSLVEGRFYYDSTKKKFAYYNGTAWVYTGEDSEKLNNQLPAYYLDRSHHTGTQNAATISDFDTQVRTNRLDQLAAPTADVSLNSRKITNLGDPVSNADAVNLSYLNTAIQNAIAGIDPKQSVKAATTANIALSGTQTIDGINLIAGDRVLVKNQNTASQNGIYVVAAGAWSRSADADTWTELVSAFTWVEQGTVNADSGWTCTVDQGGTLNTTSVAWVQFNGGAAYTSGDAINIAGNIIKALFDNTTIGINVSNQLEVKAAYRTRKVTADVGNGALTQIDITHNLNTRDVQVTVIEASGNYELVFPTIKALDVNTVRLNFSVAPTLNQYRCVVIG